MLRTLSAFIVPGSGRKPQNAVDERKKAISVASDGRQGISDPAPSMKIVRFPYSRTGSDRGEKRKTPSSGDSQSLTPEATFASVIYIPGWALFPSSFFEWSQHHQKKKKNPWSSSYPADSRKALVVLTADPYIQQERGNPRESLPIPSFSSPV